MLKYSYFRITRTWTKVIICFTSHGSRITEAIYFHTEKLSPLIFRKPFWEDQVISVQMQVSVLTGFTHVGMLILLFLAGKKIILEFRDHVLVLQPWASSQNGHGVMWDLRSLLDFTPVTDSRHKPSPQPCPVLGDTVGPHFFLKVCLCDSLFFSVTSEIQPASTVQHKSNTLCLNWSRNLYEEGYWSIVLGVLSNLHHFSVV